MKTNNLTAIIFGGSGLTGRFLTELLVKDSRYQSLVLFVRREIKVYHGKIKQVVFDPENIEKISDEMVGDQVFCCLGTTIKKAGSKDRFFKTDHDLVINFAKVCSDKGIAVFTVISSLGADEVSGNFYLSTKGQMEADLKKLNFRNLNILRPSLLLGLRPEKRFLEDVAKKLLGLSGFLMFGKLRKYKPVHAETVARAMIKVANTNEGICILESDKIVELGTSTSA